MKVRSFKALALKLSKKERGKRQVNIAQISELLGDIADLVHKDPELAVLLWMIGRKRSKGK